MSDQIKEMSNEEQEKIYYEHLDVQSLGKTFSKIFHEQVLAPEYYVTQTGRGNLVWDNLPTEEPVKNVREFLPHSRYPQRMKTNWFFKAERATQHLVVTQILSHYMFTRLGDIHYNEDPIDKIYIQWMTADGFTNPMMLEEEQYLLKNKQPFCVVHLVTKSGKKLYLDLCATQFDIASYSSDDGKTGYPYYLTENVEKGKPYAPKLRPSVRIIEMEEPVPVDSEEIFRTYLEMLLDGDLDDAEYLVEYHERMENDLRKLVNKETKRIREKRKKDRQKERKKEQQSDN